VVEPLEHDAGGGNATTCDCLHLTIARLSTKCPGRTFPSFVSHFATADLLPFWAYASEYQSVLIDRNEDPDELRNIVDTTVEDDAAELMRTALVSVEAPVDQLVRLGLE